MSAEIVNRLFAHALLHLSRSGGADADAMVFTARCARVEPSALIKDGEFVGAQFQADPRFEKVVANAMRDGAGAWVEEMMYIEDQFGLYSMYGDHFADLKDLSTKRRLCGSGRNPFELLDSLSKPKTAPTKRTPSLFPVTHSAHKRPEPDSFEDLDDREPEEPEPDYDAIWAENRAEDDEEEALEDSDW